jgi:hypothetical protein
MLMNMRNKMNCELMLTYDTPTYMFNVYKNQLSRQTGSRNLTGPKIMFINIHILSYYKLFLYFTLCLSVKLDSLSCSFTSISFCTTSVEWYYLKNNYLTLRSKVKVPQRSLWYTTHRLMVMHPHTKYHWPISKDKNVNIYLFV